MKLSEKLTGLRLPPLLTFENGAPVSDRNDWAKRREEIKRTILTEEYGFLPKAPGEVRVRVLEDIPRAFADKAYHKKCRLEFDTPKGVFSFPFDFVLPKTKTPPPVFLHINFRPDVPDKYQPTEEIIDNGFAVLSFCYQDVVSDNIPDLDKLAAMYDGEGADRCKKIGYWAFAASRLMDYIQTLDGVDKSRVAVVGHSRLGKTALLCGGLDERFSLVISNDSGCSGAALHRGKTNPPNEVIRVLAEIRPDWFCDNYRKYSGMDDTVFYDQHYLLALTAPRHLFISSAVEDLWACPEAEYLCAAAVGEVYELLGHRGLVSDDAKARLCRFYGEGRVGYHMRRGFHYLSRTDWQKFMKYRKIHQV